ncbi:hypothetical protein PP707_07105, partial [Acetobacter pasteurianus]|nr:hypothetical protein [Acetobacter pasteurianus]
VWFGSVLVVSLSVLAREQISHGSGVQIDFSFQHSTENLKWMAISVSSRYPKQKKKKVGSGNQKTIYS